jgi:photosystem II stability/assembly factor-like uncharacterized protein
VPDLRFLRRALAAGLLAACLAPAGAAAQGFLAAATKDGLDTWLAGDAGVVWRSLDGGATYSASALGTKPLRAVAARGFTVLVGGDSAQVWRSGDGGGNWTLRTGPGAASVRALALPSLQRAYAAGDGGAILRSDDGGATWTPLASGTAQRLNALAFTSESEGWAAGAGGTLLRTVDAGATWTPVALGTNADLLAVAASGADVWVGGAGGGCWRTTTGDVPFAYVSLGADLGPDVAALALPAPGEVWIAGGGGYVRRSTDGGTTWTYLVHALHGPVGGMAVANGRGVVALRSARIAARWAGGDSLSLPAGATVARSWTLQLSAAGFDVRGNTMAANPRARNTMWVALGPRLYRSRDEGETWVLTNPGLPQSRCNAFVISAKDTSVMLLASAANTGVRSVQRSTNSGQSWSTVLTKSFSEYGIPLEPHPDKPDTLFFAGDNDVLWRSVNGGLNWSAFGSTPFVSPCDLAVVPGDAAKIVVADGTTGFGLAYLLQSLNGGVSFTLRDSVGSSEVPEICVSRLRPATLFATCWSGAGASVSNDYGSSWDFVPDLNRPGQTVTSTWGADIARDDPNMVFAGRYLGDTSYVSLDGGATFSRFYLKGTNYAFLARDRGCVLALQGGGIWKMRVAYTYAPGAGAQSVAVTSPNGGEVWDSGTVHDVTWNSSGVAVARLEWRRSAADPWQFVADTDGYLGRYAWTVPPVPTTAAEIRVRDAWDGSPLDAGNAPFTIAAYLSADGGSAPASFALAPVAPTPLGAGARGRVSFDVPRAARVAVELFDVQGQRVAVLADRAFEPGRHTLALETQQLRAGVYFVRMRAGAFSATRRVLVVR